MGRRHHRGCEAPHNQTCIDRLLSTLFGLEAVMLLIALYLSTRLDMNASQASMEERELISAVAKAD